MAFAALAVASVVAVTLWVLGRRFARRFVELTGAMPPLTWMFRRANDPELERNRRYALALVPVLVISLAAYLLRP